MSKKPPTFTHSGVKMAKGLPHGAIEAALAGGVGAALKLIARGRLNSGRPLDGEIARQMARESLTRIGETW